ncbi:hypothetical protein BX283_7840 [Streptomyces sp. TLI_146]|nr:hypothetical protein BX283_7840 [Streptomyces sp. TLI_146]
MTPARTQYNTPSITRHAGYSTDPHAHHRGEERLGLLKLTV